MSKIPTITLFLLLTTYYGISNAFVCNEAVCASVVSKCMLTQSCKCDLTHCSCCKDCFSCLNYLYDECCSCVDMCPGRVDAAVTFGRQSHVEDIPGSVPELFAALTAESASDQWHSVTIPVAVSDLSLQRVEDDHSQSINCTVAYMSQCTSLKKCRSTCESMGSSSFRWFHDGCCECIGDTCKNYGSEESKCLACGKGITKEEELSEDDYDFGEDMEPQGLDIYT